MGRRVREGDVIEIAVPGGTAYAQYIGEHPLLGGTLLLDPSIHADPLPDPLRFDGERGYYVFYPLRAAVRRGMVKVRGHAPLGNRSVPDRLRRRGAISAEGRVLTWIIDDRQSQRVVESLNEADFKLPIGSVWNHEFLVQRILEGWRPEQG